MMLLILNLKSLETLTSTPRSGKYLSFKISIRVLDNQRKTLFIVF